MNKIHTYYTLVNQGNTHSPTLEEYARPKPRRPLGGHRNIRFLTGTATDTYIYDAFGLPITTTGTTPNNFLYSGEQFDSQVSRLS